MYSGLMKRRWSAALAMVCMLATAAPAAAQAQQPIAPAQQGYLGIELRTLTREEAQAASLPSGGAAVTKVEANSPAEEAGLKRGDILIEIGGRPIGSPAQALKAAGSKAPGTVVTVRVLRRGKMKTGPVKLGTNPHTAGAVAGEPAPAAAGTKPAASGVSQPEHQIAAALEPGGVKSPEAGGGAAQNEARFEIVPQLGHTFPVQSVSFSPDGDIAMSGSFDGTVKLWNVATGKLLRTFTGHRYPVNSVAFAPDGRTALSGSADSALKLWDVATGKELRTFRTQEEILASIARISPFSTKRLTGGVIDFPLHAGINSAAFSPDGRTALSGSDKTLKLWDVATGKELRTFTGHAGEVRLAVFSPDGRTALSGSDDKTLKLWDLATGAELRTFTGSTGILSAAFSPDGRTALSHGHSDVHMLWDVATGREVRSWEYRYNKVLSAAFSPDGRTALSGYENGTLTLWDVYRGQVLRTISGSVERLATATLSPDGRTVLSGNKDSTLKLWDAASGRVVRTFAADSRNELLSLGAFSPDGLTILSSSGPGGFKLWDIATGTVLRSFATHTEREPDRYPLQFTRENISRLMQLALSPENLEITAAAFSQDGRNVLTTAGHPSISGTLKLWDVATGAKLRTFIGHTGRITSVAFSPDGRTALSSAEARRVSYSDLRNLDNRDNDNTLRLWDVATGNELRTFRGHTRAVNSATFSPDGRTVLSASSDGTVKLWSLATGEELRTFLGYAGDVRAAAFSPDGRTILSSHEDGTLRLWDAATGQELRIFKGHAGWAGTVAISADGDTALSSGIDGTIRLWDVRKGRERARLMSASGGEWLSITPDGFFDAPHRDTEMFTIVRGLDVTMPGQVHQSLFNPDLVREALAGDPDGEVARSAKVVSLDKVLDAGPPPAVAITSHESGSYTNADLITLAARVTDRGKGIGRIEWRINGVTAGVMSAPEGQGPEYEVTQQLALDLGENQIEVIAYEGRNLLASLPARSTIEHVMPYGRPANVVKPTLHILAIGINDYIDGGWAPPGSDKVLAFPPLTSSVPDAQEFSAKLKLAGAGEYAEVRVTLALNADATAAKLDEVVTKMAKDISPRDTFVLYAAAHGYSINGGYYMIPQDYQGGPDLAALKARAIGQDRLQDWIANRIKAKKAIILLDTCESGALTGGYTKSRTEGPVSEAAMGRLHEATGRPVLTAASPGHHAYENYKDHGVFTFALIEALHKGDTNGNGKIEVTELAAHIEKRVPELFAELKQSGWAVKGLNAAPVRRGETGEEDKTQTAHFGSTGDDFSIVARLP